MTKQKKDSQFMKKSQVKTDVNAALCLLSDEVKAEISRIRNEGADAMKAGDYETAKSVIDFAGGLETFAGNVGKLIEQWNDIAKQHDAEPEAVKEIVGKSFFGKARKGTITTHEDFYVPLLQALVNLGGGGKTQKVVDEVGKLMKGKLKPKDFELLSTGSNGTNLRRICHWGQMRR
jgi:restriction system protein